MGLGDFIHSAVDFVFGSSGSPTLSTTFNSTSESLNTFLVNVCNTVDLNISSQTSLSNQANIQQRNFNVGGSGNKVQTSTNVDQSIDSKNIQVITSIISEILKADELADLKLDALATVTQKAESSSILKEAKGSNTSVNATTKSTSTTNVIKNMNTTLNNIARVSVENKVNIKGMNVNVTGFGNSLKVEDNVKQISKQYTNQLIDLVNKSETCRELSITEDVVSELEASQETKEKGLIETLTEGWSKVLGTFMIPIIVVGVVIVMAVIGIVAAKIFKTKRETSFEGGDYTKIKFYEF